MRFPTTTPRFAPRLRRWHSAQALTGTVTLLSKQLGLGGWNGANLRTANKPRIKETVHLPCYRVLRYLVIIWLARANRSEVFCWGRRVLLVRLVQSPSRHLDIRKKLCQLAAHAVALDLLHQERYDFLAVPGRATARGE